MKITFLGTAHGMPNPGRNRQSFLIEAGDYAYLFDAGAPVLDLLAEQTEVFSKIKAIFISHSHNDHIDGLPNLMQSGLLKNISLFLPETDLVKQYKDAYGFPTYRIMSGEIYDDGVLQVTAVPTYHLPSDNKTPCSFGFSINADEKKVHITGDLDGAMLDFPSDACSKGLNLLITECAHLTVDSLFEKLTEYKLDNVAVVHVYPNERYEQLNELIDKTDYKLILPNDGDVVEL